MKSHQILAAMPPALANDVLEFAFSADKKLYHAALEAVAQARKLRTVFLERQPRTERNASMLTYLSRPTMETVADNLLCASPLKKPTAGGPQFVGAPSTTPPQRRVGRPPPSGSDWGAG